MLSEELCYKVGGIPNVVYERVSNEMLEDRSKVQHKAMGETLSVLEKMRDALNKASNLVVGRRKSKDPGMLWLSGESIEEWDVRRYDRPSETYVDARDGFYGGPEIRQPYDKCKWVQGDLEEVQCWPIRSSDFYAAVDRRLGEFVSQLIQLNYKIPDKWKPIKFVEYVYGDQSADLWDELKFSIQEAEALEKRAVDFENSEGKTGSNTNQPQLDEIDVLSSEMKTKDRQASQDVRNDSKKVETQHSPDFRSVRWFGVTYYFTGSQAACVKMLWEAWEAGTPDVGGATLLEQSNCESKRLVDVFKKSEAWNHMIVKGQTKGTYRLAAPRSKK